MTKGDNGQYEGVLCAVRALCTKSDDLFNPKYAGPIQKPTVAVDQGVSEPQLL